MNSADSMIICFSLDCRSGTMSTHSYLQISDSPFQHETKRTEKARRNTCNGYAQYMNYRNLVLTGFTNVTPHYQSHAQLNTVVDALSHRILKHTCVCKISLQRAQGGRHMCCAASMAYPLRLSCHQYHLCHRCCHRCLLSPSCCCLSCRLGTCLTYNPS